jgi:alanyl-tRNA synthetase
MQSIQGEGEGTDYPIIGELPETNIDTGMGLERVAVMLQGADSRTLRLLEGAIRRTREQGAPMLPGETAFRLHDTYGFPYELTQEAAAEAGLDVHADRERQLLAEVAALLKTRPEDAPEQLRRRLDEALQVARADAGAVLQGGDKGAVG